MNTFICDYPRQSRRNQTELKLVTRHSQFEIPFRIHHCSNDCSNDTMVVFASYLRRTSLLLTLHKFPKRLEDELERTEKLKRLEELEELEELERLEKLEKLENS
ncbi:MAG TPA: hypothetical protein PKX96_06445 [Dysgonamonadaceae bacterium]|nr:hypothetical protein [Dysgonamonadaceae bacterium]